MTLTKLNPNKHIACETRIYRLVGTAPLLASQPADKEIHKKFIAGKIADQNIAKAEQEVAMFAENPVFKHGKDEPKYDENGEMIEKYSEGSAYSIFMTNPAVEGNPICLMSSHICGFLKESMMALERQLGIKSERKKVDLYVKMREPYPIIMRDGQPVGKADRDLTRTVRTEGMQGRPPMTVLKTSQCVDLPWYIDMPITLIPNKGTAASNPVTWDDVETALEYGGLNGLGEWRTSGLVGQFEVYRIDDEELHARYSNGTEEDAAKLTSEAAEETKEKKKAAKAKKAAKKEEEENGEE